jgi:hypothetical protein
MVDNTKIQHSKELFARGLINADTHQDQLTEACYTNTCASKASTQNCMTLKNLIEVGKVLASHPTRDQIKAEIDLDRKIMMNSVEFLKMRGK